MDFFLSSVCTHELTSVIEKVCQRKANPVTRYFDENSIHVSKFPFLLATAIETSLVFNFCSISLRSPDTPVCTTDKIVIVGAYRSENLNIVCEVHADPPPRSFKWKFNSSGESFDIPRDTHYKNGSHASILQYTPVMDQDFGTLTCSGQNEVGEQTLPCMFQVILAGKDLWLATQPTECSALIKSHPELSQHTTSAPRRIIMLAHSSSAGFRRQPSRATCLQALFRKVFTEYRLFPPRSPLDCPQLFNQQPNAALVRGSVSAWLRRRFAANISTRADCKWKIEVNGPCYVARMPLMTRLEKLYLVRGRQWRLRNDLISKTTAVDGPACSFYLFLNLLRLPWVDSFIDFLSID